MKLNIGCGPYPWPGFVNIDKNPLWKPDVVRDVTRGIPYSDNTCEEVMMSHTLEHMSNDDLIFVIGEIYRVLIPGGIFYFVVPLGSTGELDHRMQFTTDSFDILAREEASVYFQTSMRWEWFNKELVSDTGNGRSITCLHGRLRAVK